MTSADGDISGEIDERRRPSEFFVRLRGRDDPYDKLRRALKADVNEEAWATVNSNVSRTFPRPTVGKVAIKVINHYGDEVLKVLPIGPAEGQ